MRTEFHSAAGLQPLLGKQVNPGFLRCLVLSATLMLAVGCTRVGVEETGVRSVNLGPNKGIVTRDFGPGYHRYLWPLDSWNRFPSTVQHLRFAPRPPGPVTERIVFAEALQVTSADGDRVVLQADIFYRIADDAAYRVLQDSGPGDRFVGVVRTLAQDAARVVFGRLQTEDFYHQERRESARQEGAALLGERLGPRGIELIQLLVESLEFDPNYENLIKQKKVADQRVELEKALARAATQQGLVARIQVETEAKVKQVARELDALVVQLNADTDLRVVQLRAEAELYRAERGAEADLYFARQEARGQEAMLRAEAEGTRRLNEALAGDGGRNLVAMEALRHLNLVEVTFPSFGVDWLNPQEMAVRVGAEPALGGESELRQGTWPVSSAETRVTDDSVAVPGEVAPGF